MPITTNLNVNPYFDDFNANNQYYRILFKPQVAVQARELTQIQAILQNQVEKFGNWAFQNGDIVSGCSISDYPALPYVRLADFQVNTASYNINSFVNAVATSTATGLQAKILAVLPGSAVNYPNTATIYVKYLNTSSNTSLPYAFSNTDQLTFQNYPLTGNAQIDTIAVINTYSNATVNTFTTGNGHALTVSSGVVYLDGTFVQVLSPTVGIVNAYDTNAGNSVIGFTTIESIINSNIDSSLNDNSLGYSNYNAPGADRLKITPVLVALSNINANTNFNPIAQYNYGSLISFANSTSNVYSIVSSAIATRIYEEAGNFVVNPFPVDCISSSNSIVANLAANCVLARVGTGVGYASGNRIALNKTAYVNMRRGVDTRSVNLQNITFNYGGYYVLQEVSGQFPTGNFANTVYLYDAPQQSVTTKNYLGPYTASTITGTNMIGTANIRAFTYAGGIPGSNVAQYYLHLYNFQFANTSSSSRVAAIGIPNVALGDVASNGFIGASNDDQLFSFGTSGLMNLRDAAIGGNNNTDYIYRTSSLVTPSVAANVQSFTVTLATSANGGTEVLPYGVGVIPNAQALDFIVTVTSNTSSGTLPGTVTTYTTNTLVLGSGTSFATNYSPGAEILINGVLKNVNNVVNATALYVDSVYAVGAVANVHARYYSGGKTLPINSLASDSPGSINVTNSTSFGVSLYAANVTSSIPVSISYPIQRNNAFPAQKVINKNRFVKIDTTVNPNGPWSLGFPDVHRIVNIWGSTSNSSYTIAGANVMSNFVFDSGGRDSFYGLGALYSTSGPQGNNVTYPYLLVQLDYFSVNTNPGVGFFTVESYPIDDSNTANVYAIQTKNIPEFVDGAGKSRYLRDYVDFRTPCSATASDTGYIDITTASGPAITAAISAASYNPSSTVSFSSVNLHSPAYGKNFTASYTQYLPRIDLVYITPNNILGVKEGVPSLSPQTPLFPDGVMSLASVNIPAFPSLASDEVDNAFSINKTSRTTCRDTGTAISMSLVTNKGYKMSDIGKLDTRITNLEYYASLSQLQTSALNTTSVDTNGLSMFKNGIFTDPFNNYNYAMVSSSDYSAAIDSTLGICRPKISRELLYVKFNLGASTNVQQTGRVITLPYTSVPYITQAYATGYRSAASVSFGWHGTVQLIPCYSNYYDVTNTGSINITVNNAAPFQQMANSAFGITWGDWTTTTSTSSVSTTTGSQNVVNVNLGGFEATPTVAQAKAYVYNALAAQGYTGNNYVMGNQTYWYGQFNTMMTIANTGAVTLS